PMLGVVTRRPPPLRTAIPAPFTCLFYYCSGAPRDLPSFPTRRSSDLRTSLMKKLGMHDVASLTRFAIEIGLIESRGRNGSLVSKDRKSTRLNSSHVKISYAVFCLKKKNKEESTAGEGAPSAAQGPGRD